jgi:3-isopropylmalate/(R)-2-methylmalate dehydratase small subunit
VDLEAGTVTLASGEAVPFQPIPPNLLEILQAGGLVPKLKRELASERRT